MLYNALDLLPRNPRKPLQEIIQRDTISQILKQRSHRNSGTAKHPFPAHALRISFYCWTGFPYIRVLNLHDARLL